MNFELMNEPTDLLTEAYELGANVAWAHNHEMEMGITDARWARRIEDAQDRLSVIVDVIGDGAQKAYANGYDAAIDFSLNTEWRLEPFHHEL